MARGYVLQPTYRVRDGRPVVQLFGRLEDGRAFLVEDRRGRPYFFAGPPESARRALAGRPVEISEGPWTDLGGAPVVRVEAGIPGDVPPLREVLAAAGARAFEADVRFAYRYLIDRGIRSGVDIEGEAQERGGLAHFVDPVVRSARVRPELRWLSIDLETSPDAGRIYSAALVQDGRHDVLLARQDAPELPGVSRFADERALLEGLQRRVAELDPDVLLGWNVIDFDLRVIARRCRALGLRERMGRVPGEMRFRQDPGFGRQWRAEIPGRIALDGIPLVRDALRLEDYRLETVARAVLGRGKRIDHDAPDAAGEIERMYREDPAALVAYNLEDARLVPELLEREGLLELTLERSLLSGMPLDRVGASIASFDRLYLPGLRARGVVAPGVEIDRDAPGVRGGAVLESAPGLFRNVAVLDFKSLYPSLIRTFGLDPLAHARAGAGEAGAIEAPNGARFLPAEALLPDLIEEMMASRERARADGRPHADAAIKIMMNAMFGVLGSPACRFFDAAVANAITSFGQQTLAWTREAFERAGVPTLYGDTDSVFVHLGESLDPASAHARAQELRRAVEQEIGERIARDYAVESRLVLELEHVYERFWMPRVRGGAQGSKKRYAGWVEGRLDLVGLESVRRDWPAVARRLQTGMLERLFTEGDAVAHAWEIAQRVLDGELDAELVYTKRVRKASLDRYTATTPPHVQAARKLPRASGGMVRYVMTRTGPEPVLPGRSLPPGIDRGHYLERVLRPVADAILVEVQSSLDEAMGAGRQLELL